MPLSLPFRPRKIVLGALGLTCAALLSLTLPTRGQQPTGGQPDIQVAAPATASPGRTRIDATLTLPAAFQIVGGPLVRVVKENGDLEELNGLTILSRTPRMTGLCRLWTKTYPSGSYRVTVEAGLKRPDGTVTTYITRPLTLTVP